MTLHVAVLPGIHVTRRVFTPADLERLCALAGKVTLNEAEGNPTPERVKQLIRGADVAITSWGCPPLTADVLAEAPQLRAVLHAAGSIKTVITPDCWERGMDVTGAAGVLSKGVAETALGLTIVSLKNIWAIREHTRTNGWWGFQSDPVRDRIREMFGTVIGVIGGGHAGRHYIKLLRGFDVQVLLSDPTYTAAQAEELGAQLVPLEELLAAADVVTVMAPEIPATYRLLNEERFRLMKEDAILINPARGSIIDEEALIRHLKRGRFFACLDVTDPEPPEPDHPLRTLPNVVLTGHIAGAVNNGLKQIGRFITLELERYTHGVPMEGRIDPDRLSYLA
ncbi:hydroxyacid dehydrogenase [Paenibacillus sp. GD4]|uniref:hydroxyacid dehydrogenase n=1 Tax=Paenibacillus sp. GD4 TaxID=3068890 RepID=UPI002796D452|nr:hydroxyacid dehydrogenase [Paenibacillus sp. GD4]MDQ1910274.1 hydroxyacid dehydrogenase [Paenibacillus sp. GD4]